MENLTIMKFGGSSVADTKKIETAAIRIIEKKKNRNSVVVVVSAPGDMTDDLIEMANEITTSPDERELDMLLATGEQVSIALLSMAIKAKSVPVISLTGSQAGIHADNNYTKARITKIVPTKIKTELAKGKIVIVAGFQGINTNADITTLGRGGSDLTAVALAAALKADECEIYTDVDGVYTADPRLVSDAAKISVISYDEILEMAGSGAQVMQGRSIEVAKKFGVTIHVRSTFSKNNGTLIIGGRREDNRMEKAVVRAVTFDKNQAKMSILDIPDKPGIASKIFGALAKAGLNVDMIIQSAARQGCNDISFTVARTDLRSASVILNALKKKLNASGVLVDDSVAKVSIVGLGMKSHPGVAAAMFEALAKRKVNIEMISTSEIKISCIVPDSDVEKAVKILHSKFDLGKKFGMSQTDES